MNQRTAIVTGAAHGIGHGIARRLVEDGYAVGIVDIDPDACHAAVEQLCPIGKVAAAAADIANPDAVADAVARVASDLGAPTILVNNAGFARDVSFADMSIDDWDAVQNVHLRGSFLMAKAVLPYMMAARWGRVVNISSISAQGHAGRANYCAAKAGMHGFIKSLAVELGPFGITANVVAPGLIVTAMTDATAARRGLSLEDHLADAVTRIPVRRAGSPADIAHAVSYFVSEAAGFVSGQVLTVSGGVTV
ncbi:SDR family NAD(P)-dependent oxidoreductase [Sphingomonas sp. So64.6b]|uniref:SDR family oxidoreductase n=1 Tax=Sphingomonas sp. So64.6b TaxID=2997354 RepID=UPI001FCEF064|nr:SDR family NAD(P)-dependent oxidoreductase [Sphingomonas sp. So64.6b]